MKIKQYDRQIQQLTQTTYPETQALLRVQGVGHITALIFVLTLGNKERFERSRDVGCYLGLRPRRGQSGEGDPQLSITKAGNVYLRSLLIECANHILRPDGRDSALRQWGLHLAARRKAGQAQGCGCCRTETGRAAPPHLGDPGTIRIVLRRSSVRLDDVYQLP